MAFCCSSPITYERPDRAEVSLFGHIEGMCAVRVRVSLEIVDISTHPGRLLICQHTKRAELAGH